jgi:hypothetical protein
MERAAGRRFPFQNGVVRGYATFKLKDQPDAAMIPFPDMLTEGTVYTELDEASLSNLDAFVGSGFRRVDVNVQADGGDWVEAEAFVLRTSQKKRLTSEPWDEDTFRQKHLKQKPPRRSEETSK